jgi:hypothetical protein
MSKQNQLKIEVALKKRNQLFKIPISSCPQQCLPLCPYQTVALCIGSQNGSLMSILAQNISA